MGSALTLDSGNGLHVTNTTTLPTGSSPTIDGGIFSTDTLELSGGTFDAPDLSGISTVQFSSGVMTLSGSPGVTIGSGEPLDSLLVLDGGKTLNVTQATIISTGGGLTVTGGIFSTGTLILNGGSFTADDLSSANAVQFDSGLMTLPGPDGVTIGSGVPLGTQLTLGSSAMINVTHATTIASDGVLNLADGTVTTARLNMPFGSVFHNSSGTGAVDGVVLALAGSRISVDGGEVSMGDATAVSGFYSNGDLAVNDHTVTLNDANQAVFDSAALITLGDQGNSGTLHAANGLTFDFGGNVRGFGRIDTPNDPAKPVINNGAITGNSLSNPVEPITLTGYVKVVGTCDNCNIIGTDGSDTG